MCLLEAIYAAQQGRERCEVVAMNQLLVQELWSLVILGPVIVSEMRAESAGEIYMTDASNWGTAAVRADLSVAFARELHRRCLSCRVWAKLLNS